MKILKSGVEIDPRKLKKVKGGACACFCEGGSSGGVSYPATVGDVCICQCHTGMFQDNYQSAQKYI